MAKIELNIVATGEFAQVTSQIKALQAQVDVLNKSIAGVGIGNSLAKDLQVAQAAFKSTMLSTGQFTMATVKMTSETEKFGQALVAGKLKLSDYFNIITGKSGQATSSLAALTAEQVKLQESVVMADPTKKGFFSVFTPTTINKITSATKLATMQQNLYNLSVEGASKALVTWGKNTQWAGRQMTVGLTMPMVMFGATAVKTFKDVNDQLVRLQKVYGTGLTQPTQQVLDTIKSQVQGLATELASSMGIAAKDTAAMAADLAATGKTGNDLLGATREAMRLQKLGELDTQSAMQTTVSLQNVYKLSTQELTGAVDFLNAVENQTSTSLQDLAAGIPRVGPIVQQLGGSFKDTAIMMVAMKEAGVPAAQSANAIKSAIASLINPTKAAKDAFAAYNINLAGIATKEKGNPVKMIMDLQQALKGLAPLAQAQLIEKLFGKFQEARIQALITNLGAANSQTKTAFDLMNASSSELAKVAAGEIKTSTESVTGKWQRAIESFKATILPLGQKLMELGTKVLDFADKVAKAFSHLPGPVKGLLGMIAAFGLLAGPLVMLTGLFANFAGYILKGVGNIKSLVTGGTTFKQLLTPEIIASTNAAQIFGETMASDVAAVDLLNMALKNLTTTIESMNAVMSQTGAGGLAGLTRNVETAVVARKMSQPFLPGFAKGVFSLQAGGGKGKDTIPALIARGESVISASMTDKHAGLIKAIIEDKVPGFAGSRMPGSYVQNGETTFLSSPGIESAPPALKFGAQYAMEQSGQLEKSVQIIIDSLTDSAGLLTVSESQLKSYIQTDLAHISKSDPYQTTLANGQVISQKQWQMSNLTPAMGVENNFLEQMTRKNMLPYWNSKADQIQAQLGDKITAEEETAIAELRLGHQPVTKAGVTIYEKLVSQIESEALAGVGPVAGTRTQSMLAPTKALQQARLNGVLPMPVPISNVIDTSSPASMSEFKNYQAQVTEARKAGASVVQGIIEGEKAALPELEAYNEKMAYAPVEIVKARLGIKSPSEVFATEVGMPSVQGIIQGAQEMLPGLETAGTEIGTAFNESFNKPVSSVGAETHAALLAAIEQASGMTLEMHAAGMVGGEAFASGYQQAMLPLSTYTQEALPGMSAAGESATYRYSSPAGPVLPNGEMTLGRRQQLVNGKISRKPLMGTGMSMTAGMGMMMAAPLVSGAGGGNNWVAKGAGSSMQLAAMAMMIPGIGPEAALAIASVNMVYSGLKKLYDIMEVHRQQNLSVFGISETAAKAYAGQIQTASAYAQALETHINNIPNEKNIKVTVGGDNITRDSSGVEIHTSKQIQVAAADLIAGKATSGLDPAQFGKIKEMSNEKDIRQTAVQMASGLIAQGVTQTNAASSMSLLLRSAGKEFTPEIEKAILDLDKSSAMKMQLNSAIGPNTAGQNKLIADTTVYAKSLESKDPQTLKNAKLNFKGGNLLGSDEYNKVMGTNKADAIGVGTAWASGTLMGIKQFKEVVGSVPKELDSTIGSLTVIKETWANSTNPILVEFEKRFDKIGTAGLTVSQGLEAVRIKFLLDNAAAKATGTTLAQQAEATKIFGDEAYKAAVKMGKGGQYLLDHAKNWSNFDFTVPPDQVEKTAKDALGGPASFSGTAQEKATKKILEGRQKDQDAVLKSLKDQLSIYEKQTAELKRLRDFDAQRQDINNQMKNALISGNYLQAAMLKQSKSALQVDFNTGTMKYKMQDQIDTVQTRADAFATALGELTNAMNDATIKFDPKWKKTADLPVVRPSAINGDNVGGTITQHFTINGGDPNVVYQAVSAATVDASKKSVTTSNKADIKKPGKIPPKPVVKIPHGAGFGN